MRFDDRKSKNLYEIKQKINKSINKNKKSNVKIEESGLFRESSKCTSRIW